MASTQANIRRTQDMLTIAGNWVMAFGAWTVAKTVLVVIFDKNHLVLDALGPSDEFTTFFYYVLIALVLCIDLTVRFFVCTRARAEGSGKKRSIVYLIVALLAAGTNIYSAVATAQGEAIVLSVLDQIVSVVIEMTAAMALFLVIYCSLRLRFLESSKSPTN